MQFVKVSIFVFLLAIFHELGHVISAKILKLPIHKIGFQFRPYPHFYVAVQWPRNSTQKYIYLFSGTFFTVMLFIISLANQFFGLTILYWAFIIQLITETNPFYSDFTIALVSNAKLNKGVKSYAENYKLQFKKYQFSSKWYVHFIIWTSILMLLIKSENTLL